MDNCCDPNKPCYIHDKKLLEFEVQECSKCDHTKKILCRAHKLSIQKFQDLHDSKHDQDCKCFVPPVLAAPKRKAIEVEEEPSPVPEKAIKAGPSRSTKAPAKPKK